MTDHAADVEQIRGAWERLAQAWSAADPASSAAMWSVESDHRRLVRSAPTCRGRADVQRALADAFARRAGQRRTMVCRVDSVRFVRPDVAIVDGTIEVREPSDARQPVRGIAEPFTSVMTKAERDWSIAASRVGAIEPV